MIQSIPKFNKKEEDILFALYLREELTANKLLDMSETSKGNYYKVINGLLKKNLVKDVVSSNDRRVRNFKLTDKGLSIIQKEISNRRHNSFRIYLTFCMGLFYNKYPGLKDSEKLQDFLSNFPDTEIEKIENRIFHLALQHFKKGNKRN